MNCSTLVRLEQDPTLSTAMKPERHWGLGRRLHSGKRLFLVEDAYVNPPW
jgi:hypothetical protein